MKSFLEIVRDAAISLGEAPYDDKKTDEILTEATKRTVEGYEELKKAEES